jgi:hypothetical protein
MSEAQEEIGASFAEIIKVATNADGSARITLDLPEISTKIAAKLLELKMHGQGYIAVGFSKVGENE